MYFGRYRRPYAPFSLIKNDLKLQITANNFVALQVCLIQYSRLALSNKRFYILINTFRVYCSRHEK
jgi:hypothetical protein